MMNILALEVYDEAEIISCAKNLRISGLIMGDLYCSRRMFRYGKAQMIDSIRLAHSRGLYVIYQTPRYLTERIYRETLDTILYLCRDKIIDSVLLQDFGLLERLHKEIPELKLYWSNTAVPRNEADNLLHYRLLKDMGVFGVEVNRANRIKPLQSIGFCILAMYNYITYDTVNRECYYLHEKNIYDNDCERKCLGKNLLLKGKTSEMFVDGYRLGTQYQKTDISISSIKNDADSVIYAENYAGAMQRMQCSEFSGD